VFFNGRRCIIINDIYVALSSQIAKQLGNGATNALNQLRDVEQVSFVFGLFLNTACEMSGARSSTGRLF